jgi:hypothetical protein
MSNKGSVQNEITLNQNGKVIQDDDEVAKLFNVHFNSITKSLNLFEWNRNYCSNLINPVFRAIDKFRDHPSIIKIQTLIDSTKRF